MIPFKVNIFTLFPEIFPGALGVSVLGKALDNGLWSFETVQIRDYANDKHKSVDDTPFGGGAGMVMRADVLDAALTAHQPKGVILYPSPRGKTLTQAKLQDLAKLNQLNFVCGRYEGIDQRIIDKWQMVEISVGDYILSGGELASMTILDGILRLKAGVLGSEDSLAEESFESGLLEYPHYTKPAIWEGREVPEILKSGHHAAIKTWRMEQAKTITMDRRPDLWEKYQHSNH